MLQELPSLRFTQGLGPNIKPTWLLFPMRTSNKELEHKAEKLWIEAFGISREWILVFTLGFVV